MNPDFLSFTNYLPHLRPGAYAKITGNPEHPLLEGYAIFYSAPMTGIYVQVKVLHLPDGFFGMHIHEFGDCTEPFDKTGTHYNPNLQPHPEHAGDLPPLLSSMGYAWTMFYDGRLSLSEVLCKSIIIHGGRDDFTSQPSGDSGAKIGCGVIEKIH